jgi:predicted unusual protein kinase regulating ubiquinone biosynthesis (AarF/ABC1/UbiB family)
VLKEVLCFLLQVYQGRTVDGALVAIKVQRPDLLPSVLRDIYILRLGVCILSSNI